MAKIIKLNVENIKKIKAVTIKPDGNLVVIGGRNGQGKTSTLDSISYLFEGRRAICEEPVRQGKKRAKIIGELDDLVITRTISSTGGGNLTVQAKDGTKYSSPQAVMDKMVGKLAFDPLEFARLKPKAQLEALKGLVGLDFSTLDEERAKIYAERTEGNREAARIKGVLEKIPPYPDAPKEEISVSDLMAELDRRRGISRSHREEREKMDDIYNDASNAESRIAELERELKTTQAELEKIQEKLEAQKQLVGGLPSEDDDIRSERDIASKISEADTINSHVRSNRNRKENEVELDKIKDHVEKLTKQIETIDHKKAESMNEASFPIPGLSFDEAGVLYNGIPFVQLGSAEQLRVSVAMAIAMNPTLKVMLIRDGSLLDADSLRMISEMAEKEDTQIWIERVGAGKEVSVVIEDGEVAE